MPLVLRQWILKRGTHYIERKKFLQKWKQNFELKVKVLVSKHASFLYVQFITLKR